jgi:hypothetical protein
MRDREKLINEIALILLADRANDSTENVFVVAEMIMREIEI